MDGLAFYRIGNWCVRHRIPLIPAIMKTGSRMVFSSHLPCEATIGRTTILGYGGLGTVIHPRAVIGENVLVGPRVTIGGKSGSEGVPVIEDDVFIGTGACILGDVKVGAGSVVGANSVVVDSVQPRSVVAGIPARVIRSGVDSADYGDLPRQIRARRRR
jgi:serine O-acetyltransferase